MCQHDRLHFGSGDYYVMCADCGGVWARMSGHQAEYGTDANGKTIGAHPGSCDPDFRQADAGMRVKQSI